MRPLEPVTAMCMEPSWRPCGCPAAPPAAPLPGAAADSTVVATACPACWVALSFEMPRFPKPPARLEAEVIHVGGLKAAQHYAEIQAFTISGRPLVVQRVQAVRADA